MMHLLPGAFGGPAGYLRLPGNPVPTCDKEQIKLLPESKRIRQSEIDYLLSVRPEARRLVAERGIDLYEDDEDTMPEECKQYWALLRACHALLERIEHLEACKAQQGVLSSVNYLFKKGKTSSSKIMSW